MLSGARGLICRISMLLSKMDALIWVRRFTLGYVMYFLEGVDYQYFEIDFSNLFNIVWYPEEWSGFSILSDKFRELQDRFLQFSLSSSKFIDFFL